VKKKGRKGERTGRGEEKKKVGRKKKRKKEQVW
jgi:hypothetical protein